MNLTLVEQITKKQLKSDIPVFKAGDTLKVYVKIKEGNKYRIQLFEGVFLRDKVEEYKKLSQLEKFLTKLV